MMAKRLRGRNFASWRKSLSAAKASWIFMCKGFFHLQTLSTCHFRDSMTSLHKRPSRPRVLGS